MFWCEDLQEGQVFGVAGRGGRAARRGLGGEAAESVQCGDGGEQEAFLARPFFEASSGLDGVLVCRGLLGGGEFGLLRALPALHGFTEDGGALGLGKGRALPGGGAGPAFFDLAEITADMVPIPAQQRGDFAGGMALKKEALDFGQAGVLVGGGRFFFVV